MSAAAALATLRSLLLATPGRVVGTAVAVLLFALLAAALYGAGRAVKRRGFDDETVEAAQAVAVTVAAVVAAVYLVRVWEATDAVRSAVGVAGIGPETGVRLLVSFLALVGAYTLSRLVNRFVTLGEGRDAISAHQREVAHHVFQILAFVPALAFVLALWQVNPANLLLGAGALGIVIGLAARQTLGAVLAGFVLLFSRPFQVGDWVEIDGREGLVTDVTIVNTVLRTFDGEVVLIPNDEVTSEEIVNRTRTGRLRVTVEVGVDYDADLERAVTVAREAMSDLDELMDGRPPEVTLDRFGDSAVVLSLRFWIADPTVRRKWDAQNAVVEAVKDAFEREGVDIPFPQRALAFRGDGGSHRGTPESAATNGTADGGAGSAEESP